MKKRGTLDRRGLIEATIRGREAALRAAGGKNKEIEAELASLRKKLAALPAEEAPCDGSDRP